MPLKIVRNDITKMNTEAIVNTANSHAVVGSGCDNAVYKAAGYDELLAYRKEKIGCVPEGEVFITPGFNLQAKYIIHAVSPHYQDGDQKEEEKLRSCYRKSLLLAKEKGIKSIAFPLISTGGFGYPKEEGIRIAVDEINAFLLSNDMDIFLVVFDTQSTLLGEKIYPELEAYIDHNYVYSARKMEYGNAYFSSKPVDAPDYIAHLNIIQELEGRLRRNSVRKERMLNANMEAPEMPAEEDACDCVCDLWNGEVAAQEEFENKLNERLAHKSDTFSEYLMYLIESKGMKNADVYNRACVDRRYFSKIKNNKDFHPEKIKALCLCVGARLNLDETKDLLARAGYAISPADLTDIIFTFFIEHKYYDVVEIAIQLEEHGLPCILSEF